MSFACSSKKEVHVNGQRAGPGIGQPWQLTWNYFVSGADHHRQGKAANQQDFGQPSPAMLSPGKDIAAFRLCM
jgi:hypothetical protein